MTNERFKWTDEWKARLKEEYPILGARGFIEKYNLQDKVSIAALGLTARYHGIRMSEEQKLAIRRKARAADDCDFVWSDEWLEKLRQDYPTLGGDGFKEKHNMIIPAVRIRDYAQKRGIFVNDDVRKKIRQETRSKTNKTEHMREQGGRGGKITRSKFVDHPEWEVKRMESVMEARSRPENIEQIRKLGKENVARINASPELVAKKNDATRAAWQPGGTFFEHPELCGFRNQRKNEYTDIEDIVKTMLDKLGVSYVHDEPLSVDGVTRFPDFFVKDRKIIIECDGDYWHDREERKLHDSDKDVVFIAAGFVVLRFAGSIIKDDPEAVFLGIKAACS